MRLCTTLVIAAVCILGIATVGHTIPQLINYQGILTDGGGTPITVPTTVEFRIWSAASGGTQLWMESQSVNPDAAGRFRVLLGSVTPIPESAFDGDAYLGMTISPDPEMTPRFRLVSVGYSFKTGTVNGATGGAITTKVTIGPGHTNPGLGAFCAGAFNNASGSRASVTGGNGNTAEGDNAAIAGGEANEAQGLDAFVGSGLENHANNTYSVVVSGETNDASGEYSFIGSGVANQATNTGSIVVGGDGNGASGLRATVLGGLFNYASGSHATIGGGRDNRARGDYSVVAGGGGPNNADSNYAEGNYSTVGGGVADAATGSYATVGGGSNNTAAGNYAIIGGGSNNTASDLYATVSGGRDNVASDADAAIGGGLQNTVDQQWGTVAGGAYNQVSGMSSVIGGGTRNHIVGSGSVIGGGDYDTVSSAIQAAIGGGYNNFIGPIAHWATIGGGTGNRILDESIRSTIGGGEDNAIAAHSACIPGGMKNAVTGPLGFAAGYRAKSQHRGSFVWADSTEADFVSTGVNQFLIRASGGVGINTNVPTNVLTLPNVNSTDGRAIAYAWDTYSSRRWKTNITTIDDALSKVEQLRGVEFDSRSNGRHDIGLIAEEVGEVVPEVVKFEDNGVDAQSVDYSRLVALLIQGMKEQQQQIKDQQSQIETLRTQVRDLKRDM